ncbi:transcriptional regulator [Mycolicibacterium helvum]
MWRASPSSSHPLATIDAFALRTASGPLAQTFAAISRALVSERVSSSPSVMTLPAVFRSGCGSGPLSDDVRTIQPSAKSPPTQYDEPSPVSMAARISGLVSISSHASAINVIIDGVSQVRSGHGGGHPMPIGTQIPHRPPYGASTVAWRGPDVRERWLGALPEDVRERYREAITNANQRGYAVGLHILPDLRLQELALVVRSAEVRSTRLSQLAQALTDELIHQEEWFPVSLAPKETYTVSHIHSPILGPDSRISLMLSLVPSAEPMSGADVTRAGEQLAAVTRRLSVALSTTCNSWVPGAEYLSDT